MACRKALPHVKHLLAREQGCGCKITELHPWLHGRRSTDSVSLHVPMYMKKAGRAFEVKAST